MPSYISLFPNSVKAVHDVMSINEKKHGFGRANDGRTENDVWRSFKRHLSQFEKGNLVNEEDGGVKHIHQAMIRLIEYVDMLECE